MSGDRDLVLLGLRTKDVANLPNCAVVEKPVPLSLLDRLLQSTRHAAVRQCAGQDRRPRRPRRHLQSH